MWTSELLHGQNKFVDRNGKLPDGVDADIYYPEHNILHCKQYKLNATSWRSNSVHCMVCVIYSESVNTLT